VSDAPHDVTRYERRERVAWLTIDRPEQRNALTPGVIEGIHAGLARAVEDPDVRAIVLTGAGEKSFCAGADLKLMASAGPPDPSLANVTYADLLRAFMGCAKPTIARVNGHCLAGGMGLLAVCDLAVAIDSAQFGLPEVKVGLFAMQVVGVLRPLVGVRMLAEMTLTGEPIDAHAARAAGLVNDAVRSDAFDAKVDELTARLIDKSPTAQRHGKKALRAIEGMTPHAALPFLEAELTALAHTDDAREGRRAFAEKRKPVWTGT